MNMNGGDDGRIRTGTFWSALAHAFTAVVGSGILAIPWSVAQLGWILGPITLLIFAGITFFTANLLTDCYRVKQTGRRNYTYMDAVRCFLGKKSVVMCASLQYSLLWGVMISYTITTAMSIATLQRSICHHNRTSINNKKTTSCDEVPGNLYMLLYGGIQIMLSQFPNLEEVTVLSYTAAITSIGYCFISLGLATTKFIANPIIKGTIRIGVVAAANAKDVSIMGRVWNVFQALGNIAFAFTYSILLLEIEDTLKSPPAEEVTMRKVSIWGVTGTALFYITLGCMGYAAFGNDVNGNILTENFKPFWIVDIGNIAVIIHLLTAYQVFAQPIYAAIESRLESKYSFFITPYTITISKSRKFKFILSRVVFRTLFVIFTTFIAMAVPFFNAIVGILGSLSFWPLTIHLPLQMFMVQGNIRRGSITWWMLMLLDGCCLMVTIVAAIGSSADIVERLRHVKMFHNQI